MSGHFAEKPYPQPLGPGEVARVDLARSAKSWLPDIEAYLVEQQLNAALAPIVVGLMDRTGWTLERAVGELRVVLREGGQP